MRLPFLREERPPLMMLYEHNYMAFRLIVPEPPVDDGWHMLQAEGRKPLFLRRISDHPYTSEWQLGHFFPERQQALAPDHLIRLYHDARLAEAIIDPATPARAQREKKYQKNRALGEWLDYCRRHRYRMAGCVEALR
ncbi:MAG: DUF1249 domain-containing protein [Cardiobacteriaceae bacterium]|nr:DUF1249 domain-containing protein [Cardiobacteriaceae bacterium]